MATKQLENFPSAHNALLKKWEAAKKAMAEAQDIEKELRLKVVEMVTDQNQKTGTINFNLGNGYKCKIVKTQRYTLDKDKINDALDAIERTGEQGKLISDRLVKFDPRLMKSEYDMLPPSLRAIIDPVITVSDATPTVEIIEPDAKKSR